MSCLCVVGLLCCVLLLDSSRFVAIVRIRSTLSVCLLPGLIVLPCGISGKMTIPSKSLLSLIARCSLYCYATLPTTCYIMPPTLPCQPSSPPSLANHCLAMLPLCLAPLIALLVAGEVEVCSMLEHGYVGISLLYLIYFNASIYLVKDGRLGLMPGVLFHSCRPSFCHTGVYVPWFCVPYTVGCYGNSLTVCFE